MKSHFSSGPTRKPPRWQPAVLNDALVGRSHRSVDARERINMLINLTRELLNLPDDFHLALMPGSATGAMEAALWSLLGPVGVDVITYDVFGDLWLNDVVNELRLTNVNIYEAPYGALPSLTHTPDRDLVINWNGTTTGVWIPEDNWINEERTGLVIVDATSIAFAHHFNWSKIDAFAFSWQKVIGGEAAHGMLVLSPRAVQRLKGWIPPWPMPRLYNLRSNDQPNAHLFAGATLNTPSMLCIEDALFCLKWLKEAGGLNFSLNHCRNSQSLILNWLKTNEHFTLLAQNEEIASPTCSCIIVKPWQGLPHQQQVENIQNLCKQIAAEDIGYDLKGHALAPPCIRIWTGPTVSQEDVSNLLCHLNNWAKNSLT